jgi:sugar lactone lactonase YvrE
MTTPEIEPESVDAVESPEESADNAVEKDERKRRLLLLLLLLLLLCLCCVGGFFLRYLMNPEPLPQMVPAVNQVVNYPPAYKLSMPLVKPVAVAVSPDGQRIYGAESMGDRLLRVYDREGNLRNSFAPPFTNKSNRSWDYMAVDAGGRVFAVDTYNDVIAVFDKEGNFIDGIISKDTTLSKVVAQKTGGSLPKDTVFYYDNISKSVIYQIPGQAKQSIPVADRTDWSPLGIRFDSKGNLLMTNTAVKLHQVFIFPAEAINGSWINFNPQIKLLGQGEGKDIGQFSFPNTAVTDSHGNFYISDSNNGRISKWTPDLQYKTFFGFGSTGDALNLPHGIWMDTKDRLHVADSVGQMIRVYDVSGSEAKHLYNFGVFGIAEGQFDFPNDICMDGTGRLYIADRENDRIQVWSY